MDALTDVLAVADTRGTVLGCTGFAVPWGILFDQGEKSATGPVMHVVADGTCCLRAGGHLPQELGPGDVVLMPQGGPHILSDHPESRAVSLQRAKDRNAALMQTHTGEVTTVLSLGFQLDLMAPGRVMDALPEPMVLRADTIARHPQLSLLVQLMRTEARAPGAGAGLVLPRLLDSLLALVLRAWLAECPGQIAPSWLKGLTDPGVAQVLNDLHAHPADGWTLRTMSLSAGLARATFARRFADLVGETPKAYLNRWRLELAAARICAGTTTIEAAGAAFGYSSAAAFARAFRREFGIAPSDLRRTLVNDAPEPAIAGQHRASPAPDPAIAPPAFLSSPG